MDTWIIIVEWLARLILFGLIGLSVWSISIIIDRKKLLNDLLLGLSASDLKKVLASGDSQQLNSFLSSRAGIQAETIKLCLQFNSVLAIDRSVQVFLLEKKRQYEKGFSVLGTLGSTSPFIGLLGTILGIIVAFGALSTGQLDSQKIMYALAEALILTAVGLGVAIPAVVYFNYFNRTLNSALKDCEALKDQYVAYFLKN